MFEDEIKKTATKTLTELAVKSLFALGVGLVCYAVARIVPVLGKLFQQPEYGPISFGLLVAFAVAVILMLIRIVRMHRRYEQFQEKFGVFWDRDYRMRCLSCRKPLKHSSRDPSAFFCADPKCNSKHTLRGADGSPISYEQAVAMMKQS